MKVYNLGKEIDNLHKNVVEVESKRGIKTADKSYGDSATTSNLADADEQKRRINDFNLELGRRAYKYQMLASGKYRNTRDKEKVIAEWEAYRSILVEAAEHDSRIPKMGLESAPEQYVNLSIKYCKSLYIYTYLIRPWLDKTSEQQYKDKKLEWMSHDYGDWQRYGSTRELPPDGFGCTAERCVIECPYYDSGGIIKDEQVHTWYEDEYECITTEEVRMLDALE
jgi:hypothetical protein